MEHPFQDDFLSRMDGCLVVEDDPIILLDLEDTLQQLGLKNVHTAATARSGEALAASLQLQLGILDFKLHTESSLNVARILASRGIPVILLTAYGEDIVLPEDLQSIPIISKPFTTDLLQRTLLSVARGRSARPRLHDL